MEFSYAKMIWRYDWKMLTYNIIMDGRGLQLLGWSSGFIVAPTHQPCTKGLWLWSALVKCTTLNNIEYNLLLLDNEDMDTYDKTIFFNSPKHLCDNDSYPTT
jgi:hypothetical protein